MNCFLIKLIAMNAQNILDKMGVTAAPDPIYENMYMIPWIDDIFMADNDLGEMVRNEFVFTYLYSDLPKYRVNASIRDIIRLFNKFGRIITVDELRFYELNILPEKLTEIILRMDIEFYYTVRYLFQNLQTDFGIILKHIFCLAKHLNIGKYYIYEAINDNLSMPYDCYVITKTTDYILHTLTYFNLYPKVEAELLTDNTKLCIKKYCLKGPMYLKSWSPNAYVNTLHTNIINKQIDGYMQLQRERAICAPILWYLRAHAQLKNVHNANSVIYPILHTYLSAYGYNDVQISDIITRPAEWLGSVISHRRLFGE
jgi:hypothetical protein